jgi:hypothetical protein
VQAGILPVSRFYIGHLMPDSLFDRAPEFGGVIASRRAILDDHQDSLAYQITKGRPLIELHNEPNRITEWRDGIDPTWQDTALVEQVAETIYQDIRTGIENHARIAIPAMAPTERGGGTHPRYSSIRWAFGIWDYWMTHYRSEIKNWIAQRDLWLASHSCMLAERDFSHDARQTGDDMSPNGYEIFLEKIVSDIGIEPWVLITEGGPYSPDHREHLGFSRRYDDQGWAQAILDMLAYLEDKGNVKAWCPWLYSDQQNLNPDFDGSGWVRADGTERAPVQVLREAN